MSLRQQLFGVLLGQASMTALNVVTGILSARLLGAEGRGVFAAVSFWPQLLGAIAIGGMPVAIVYLGRKFPQAYPALARASLGLGAIATLLATVIGLIIVPRMLESQGPEVATLGAVCTLFVFVNIGHMVCRQLLVARQSYRRFNLACWMPSFTFLVALLALHAAGRLDAWTAAVAVSASGLPVLIWLVWVVLKAGPLEPARGDGAVPDDAGAPGLAGMIRELWRFGLRGTPGEVVMVLGQHIDRLILVALVAPAELGLYVVALSFSRLLLILQVSTSAVLLPSMAGRDRDDLKWLHDRAFWITMVGAGAAAGVAIIAGGPALRLFYGAEFEGARPIFQLLIIEAALACVAQVTSHLFQVIDRPGVPSTIQVCSFALALAGCAILVPTHGALGAAMAMLIATLGRLSMLLAVAGASPNLGLPLPTLPWRRPGSLAPRGGRAE